MNHSKALTFFLLTGFATVAPAQRLENVLGVRAIWASWWNPLSENPLSENPHLRHFRCREERGRCRWVLNGKVEGPILRH
jgi:hypothetical protein